MKYAFAVAVVIGFVLMAIGLSQGGKKGFRSFESGVYLSVVGGVLFGTWSHIVALVTKGVRYMLATTIVSQVQPPEINMGLALYIAIGVAMVVVLVGILTIKSGSPDEDDVPDEAPNSYQAGLNPRVKFEERTTRLAPFAFIFGMALGVWDMIKCTNPARNWRLFGWVITTGWAVEALLVYLVRGSDGSAIGGLYVFSLLAMATFVAAMVVSEEGAAEARAAKRLQAAEVRFERDCHDRCGTTDSENCGTTDCPKPESIRNGERPPVFEILLQEQASVRFVLAVLVAVSAWGAQDGRWSWWFIAPPILVFAILNMMFEVATIKEEPVFVDLEEPVGAAYMPPEDDLSRVLADETLSA